MTTETSIRVKVETKDLLDKLGSKGDSYDDIILRLALKALKEAKK